MSDNEKKINKMVKRALDSIKNRIKKIRHKTNDRKDGKEEEIIEEIRRIRELENIKALPPGNYIGNMKALPPGKKKLEKIAEKKEKEDIKLDKLVEKNIKEKEKNKQKERPQPITKISDFGEGVISKISSSLSDVSKILLGIALLFVWAMFILKVPYIKQELFNLTGIIVTIVAAFLFITEFLSYVSGIHTGNGHMSRFDVFDSIEAILFGIVAALETSAVVGIFRFPWSGWWIIINVILFIFSLVFFNSLYSSGGPWSFITVTIFILLIAYVLTGPYSAYADTYINSIKSATDNGFVVLGQKMSDFTLLLTNPIEYNARMQERNVQAEQETTPGFVEISDITPYSPVVPNGTIAASQVTVSNDAKEFNLVAKNVTLSVSCEHCTMENPIVFKIGDMRPREKRIFTVNTTASAKKIPGENLYFKYNLSYEMSSTSNLRVEEVSQDYVNQMLMSGNNIFKNVVATCSPGPAAISLNVGKQPLISDGAEKILLISLVNMINEGDITIPKDSTITVKVPVQLIDQNSGIKCESGNIWEVSYGHDNGYDVIKIRPAKTLNIKYLKRVPIYCHFVPNKVEEHGGMPVPNEGIIIASIDKYVYKTKTTQGIKITYPIIIENNKNNGNGGNNINNERASEFEKSNKGKTLSEFFNSNSKTQVTRYYLADEDDFSKWYTGKTPCTDGRGYCCIPMDERGFYEDVKCEGTGVGHDGNIYRYYDINTTKQESKVHGNIHSANKPSILACGGWPVVGETIAADKRIPCGTHVCIYFGDGNGWNGCYVVEDRGSAITGNHIDFFAGFGKEQLHRISSQTGTRATITIGCDNCQEGELWKKANGS